MPKQNHALKLLYHVEIGDIQTNEEKKMQRDVLDRDRMEPTVHFMLKWRRFAYY